MNKFQVIDQLMKSDGKSTAEKIKILRKFEKHCAKQARLKKNSSNNWNTTREDTFSSRRALSKQARYNGLARQYLRGVKYTKVENSVRNYNFPQESEISRVLSEWGIKHDVFDLVKWTSA